MTHYTIMRIKEDEKFIVYKRMWKDRQKENVPLYFVRVKKNGGMLKELQSITQVQSFWSNRKNQ